MNADQIALAALKLQEMQLWITGLAIFLGPLAGVIFTIWFQHRKERLDTRQELFLDLMAERKAALGVSPNVARALNKIDVVFAESSKVKTLWHEYYALLQQPPGELRNHKWLELLVEMAKELGYTKLSQTDLDKFYLPQGYVDNAEFQKKVQEQWARVLENTEHFVISARANNS